MQKIKSPFSQPYPNLKLFLLPLFCLYTGKIVCHRALQIYRPSLSLLGSLLLYNNVYMKILIYLVQNHSPEKRGLDFPFNEVQDIFVIYRFIHSFLNTAKYFISMSTQF